MQIRQSNLICPKLVYVLSSFSRSSLTDQVRMAELELTAQALKGTLREKEKEVEGTVRELRKQQADKHR